MPSIKQLVTQTGNDTDTYVSIDTNLTAEGKSGWQINAVEAYWVDVQAVAAGDYKVEAIVNTTGTTTTAASDDELARLEWALQNTGGVAVAFPVETNRQIILFEPRITVQPEIFVGVESVSTSQANDVIFIIYYEIVKLSDLEVLRLLAGGA